MKTSRIRNFQHAGANLPFPHKAVCKNDHVSGRLRNRFRTLLDRIVLAGTFMAASNGCESSVEVVRAGLSPTPEPMCRAF